MTTESGADGAASRGRLARLLGSARARVALTFIVGMTLAGLLVIVAVRAILLSELAERTESALIQERSEFGQFVERGVDPENGEPLSNDLARGGVVYIEQNVFPVNEALIVLGNPGITVTSADAPADLLEDVELLADIRARDDVHLREIDSPAGPATVLAVPVLRGGERSGSLIFAIFTGEERGQIDDVLRVIAQVMAVAVLVVGLLAWAIAAGILRPLRQLTDTAQRISEEHLSSRLVDPGGDDEVAVLVRTFNGMLDRLERAVSGQRQFLADAGHELRTPLTVVHGHVEQLEAGIVPEDEIEETLALVREEVARMGRLVEDLLLLARAEQPDFLQRERVDLAELTQRIFQRARAIDGPEWRVVAGTGELRADEDRLIQAALNLVDNAARHSPVGSPVTIGSSRNGAAASIWVEDSGPGVPPGERGHLLDRFARGPERRRSGTGLGLAIARTIAEAHGGRIDIDDGVDGGARFSIVVPTRGGGP